MTIQLSEITFDEQDANLFQVDDPRLRADALKHSILPRLQVVLNEAIQAIHKIYGIDVFEDSIISVYPNFRPTSRRSNELKVRYQQAFAGLAGKQKANWLGFSRKDHKPVKFLPFRFGFCLSEDGVFVVLESGWLNGLTNDSFRKLLQFHLDEESYVNALCFHENISPIQYISHDLPFPSPISEQYKIRLQNGYFDNHFIGYIYDFPIKDKQLRWLISNYVAFYPVYDSYIRMAKGE